MDELEWLKEHSPSTEPSREITRRHRTQLRAAIATEGADGTRPRRPRRGYRSRHRVLVTTAVVVVLCAVGAGVVALTSSGGDDGNTVDAPAASDSTTTAPALACAGAPPKELAVPAGFGTASAAPAQEATAAPSSTQQVTSWTSDSATIEQRWPADADVAKALGAPSGPKDSIASSMEPRATVDENGVAHRTIVFIFGSQPAGCANLQVTVYGRDTKIVDDLVNALFYAPFTSTEPLVTTTQATASAPTVVACDGVTTVASKDFAVPVVVATVGGPVSGAEFAQPADALADFLPAHGTLAQRGYQELRLDDSSVVYVKDMRGIVVTTVHVVPARFGWTVADWQASGC